MSSSLIKLEVGYSACMIKLKEGAYNIILFFIEPLLLWRIILILGWRHWSLARQGPKVIFPCQSFNAVHSKINLLLDVSKLPVKDIAYPFKVWHRLKGNCQENEISVTIRLWKDHLWIIFSFLTSSCASLLLKKQAISSLTTVGWDLSPIVDNSSWCITSPIRTKGSGSAVAETSAINFFL